jgi:sugar lactone lactonase YvrE
MSRAFLTVVVLLVVSPKGYAQDMPLSQILIDGEGWKQTAAQPLPEVAATTTNSPNGSTVFTWRPECEGFVYAKQAKVPGAAFTPYCPLRVGRGEKPRVTALTTDRDGRIYAATPQGVQVFDPTGRLCGVLSPASPDALEYLAFVGDHLVGWAGNTTYSRKLKTTGAR